MLEFLDYHQGCLQNFPYPEIQSVDSIAFCLKKRISAKCITVAIKFLHPGARDPRKQLTVPLGTDCVL
jgi:hypothetical protein